MPLPVRTPPRRLPTGEAALVASATLFAVVDIAVKLASRIFSGFFISSIRFAFGAVLCVAVLGLTRPRPLVVEPVTVVLRGLFGAVSMVLSYLALSATGPGRATLLANMYPLFVALFGALLFHEKLRARTLLSIGVCTAGALLVVRDGSGASLGGDLLALASAVFAGLAVNCVRRASKAGASPFLLYLAPCLFGLPLLLMAPRPEGVAGPGAWALLVLVGLASFGAQALMAVGYRSVPAGRGSVIFYGETALAILFGVLLAGEAVNLRFLGGLGVILVGLWLNRDRPEPRSRPS